MGLAYLDEAIDSSLLWNLWS